MDPKILEFAILATIVTILFVVVAIYSWRLYHKNGDDK